MAIAVALHIGNDNEVRCLWRRMGGWDDKEVEGRKRKGREKGDREGFQTAVNRCLFLHVNSSVSHLFVTWGCVSILFLLEAAISITFLSIISSALALSKLNFLNAQNSLGSSSRGRWHVFLTISL